MLDAINKAAAVLSFIVLYCAVLYCRCGAQKRRRASDNADERNHGDDPRKIRERSMKRARVAMNCRNKRKSGGGGGLFEEHDGTFDFQGDDLLPRGN